MAVIETDVCIIGGGITAAMLAEKLSELRPGLSITIVEAGDTPIERAARIQARRRTLEYGENPWPGDFIADQTGAQGLIALTMAVGGLALRWGGACNRFSVEDLRLKSLYGLADDWPLEWDELEKAYVEAERRLNVFGNPSAYAMDTRSAPYPVPAQPLSYNLQLLKSWAEQSGTKFDPLPMAHNLTPFGGRGACCLYDTCGQVCPTGARYSPDYTIAQLVDARRATLHTRTLVRRLALDDKRDLIAAAHAVNRDKPEEPVEYRARTFVLAAGHAWSPYLLLLSATSRFPNGLANRSDAVGRYMNGHKFLSAQVMIDTQLYPGQFSTYSLISRRYFRCPADRPYVRHDTRVWESATGRGPRLRGDDGRLLLGDEVLTDWRARSRGGSVRLRAYYDIHPARGSGITLNASARNKWGDPLPALEHKLDSASEAREAATHAHIRGVFQDLARADNGRVLSVSEGDYLDHPAGGCRMGSDPATSVCDSYGQTHDHENLFVVGAPTLPTGGCTNGTLTFVALTLRSAARIAEAFPRTQARSVTLLDVNPSQTAGRSYPRSTPA